MWTHGGKKWEFWEKAGGFLYIFGQLINDDESQFFCPGEPYPIKIGITTDPKQRLANLRRQIHRGGWLEISWMQSSASLMEKSLHELFNPWRCPFQREWFALPDEVEEWLFEGMMDNWSHVSKQDRIVGETVRSIICDILPSYYQADWLKRRLKEMRRYSC